MHERPINDSAGHRPPIILCADDDPDDRVLLRDAVRESTVADVIFVEDGEQLIAYLRREGAYADAAAFPRPGVVLLDLNMPVKDGREALKEIKADADLRSIPVVVFSTSHAPSDVRETYESGASSYISKPTSFEGLVEVVRNLSHYWFETVNLPSEIEA